MKKIFLFCATFLFGVYQVNGQVGFSPLKTFPSPNTASLGEFGVLPPSPFNGQVGISIPLYDVVYRDINIPLSVSYSTKGNRIEEHPGIVGLGWTLQAGGIIYRKVNGIYDEHPPESPGTNEPLSYYYNCGKIKDNFHNLDKVKKYAWDGLSNSEVIENVFDGMPDEFIFNFNEYSGVFYITRPYHNGPVEIKVKSNGAYKLKAEILEIKDYVDFDDYPITKSTTEEIEKSRSSRSIYKLKITDEKGIQYIFGGINEAIEFSNGGNFTSDFYNIASTWHLTEIISLSGDVTRFSYIKKGRTITPHRQRSMMAYSASYDFFSYNHALIIFALQWGSGSHSYSGAAESSNYLIGRPSFLQSIITPNQRIDFKYSESNELKYNYTEYFNPTLTEVINNTNTKIGGEKSYWLKLDNITIRNGVQKIEFDYDNLSDRRLKLIGIQKYPSFNDGLNISQSYKFKYNSLSLPLYGSKMADHWGYYNGRSYGYDDNYYTTREPNQNYLKAEMLEEITYPTGGFVNLEYEAHTYQKTAKQFPFEVVEDSSSLIAGGLRVKAIISAPDLNTIPARKEYYYISGYLSNGQKSSGILSGLPNYANTGSRYTSYKSGNFWSGGSGSAEWHYTKGLDNNFYTLSTTNGDHITYSEVVEKGGGNGYIRYLYSNHDNGYNDFAPYLMHSNFNSAYHEEHFNSRETSRGLLLKTEYYSKEKVLLKSIENAYNFELSDYYKVPVFYRAFERSIGGHRASTFHFLLKKPTLSSVVEKVYTGVGTGSTSMTYKYYPNVSPHPNTYPYLTDQLDNFQPVEIYSINSKNETLKTTYKYPFDFSTGVYPSMVAKNIISPVIEQTSSITKYGTTTPVQLNLTRTNYFNPSGSIYVPSSVEVQISNTANVARQLFNKYDNKGNVLEMQKEYDTKEVYLWGYKSQYPVAKIVGSDHATAAAKVTQSVLDNATGGSDDASLRTHLDNLRTISGAFVTTYTYKPLIGMTSETDPNGRTTYYEYDSFSRLYLVKDQEGKIVKKSCYNYAGQEEDCGIPITYYNSVKSGTFTRNNCPSGQTGSSVTYTVVAGKYSSIVSQADADQKAQNDVNANGQNYANVNGTCTTPFVDIKLRNLFFSESFPASIKVEFIQNGTVIKTAYFPTTKSATIVRGATVSPGTYQLRFTLPNGFENYSLIYQKDNPQEEWTSNGNGLQLTTGNVVFSYGTNYMLTASDGI